MPTLPHLAKARDFWHRDGYVIWQVYLAGNHRDYWVTDA